MKENIRIQKYLSQCGVASRRASEKMIEDGLVCANKRLAMIGQSIDPDKDEITVKGRLIKPGQKNIYIALNKPQGYISSCSRSQGAALVDLVKINEKVFPVGRLDKDSEGLILLTNDGELANRLTHPRYECEKEYEVKVNAEEIKAEELKSLERGVVIEEGRTKPCKLKQTGKNSFRIIIKEGKKRQIRRMCQAIGKKVVRLKRIRIKELELGDLMTGKWRHLTEEEIKRLRA
ncbi:MAG: pseudouridine synthase [Candidatus Saganbacteria bacterium]|nr:pseudouridine synthase [Candidatus Saganbacteria bacterium]